MKIFYKAKRQFVAYIKLPPVWAVAKLTSSAMEKLAVGSALVGIFQQNSEGLWICAICFGVSAFITALDARK